MIKLFNVFRFFNEYNFLHFSKKISKPDIEKIFAEDFKNLNFFLIFFFIYYFLPVNLTVLRLLLFINNLNFFGYEINLLIISFPLLINLLFLIIILLLLPATF